MISESESQEVQQYYRELETKHRQLVEVPFTLPTAQRIQELESLYEMELKRAKEAEGEVFDALRKVLKLEAKIAKAREALEALGCLAAYLSVDTAVKNAIEKVRQDL